MQKTDFVRMVAERAGVSQQQTKQIVDAALEAIAEALQRGEKVTLTGFGTFEVRQRQEREGVNPQTRAKIKIAATKTPGFSASSTLKEAVRARSERLPGGGGGGFGRGLPGHPAKRRSARRLAGGGDKPPRK